MHSYKLLSLTDVTCVIPEAYLDFLKLFKIRTNHACMLVKLSKSHIR